VSGDGWRPIATAPRDGRRVLGWCAGWPGPTPIHFEWGDWAFDNTMPADTATHWMPLPTPPSGDEESEGR
jgi:hypothetical protein